MANDSSKAVVTTKGDFQSSLKAVIQSSASLLPKHMTPERMFKLVYAAATKTPKLFECTTASIGVCLVTCSELGLEPGDIRGHVYLIPYGNQCTVIIGYKGYLELARRSGEIEALDASVVYEGEHFVVTRGLDPRIDHTMSLTCDRSDAKIVAAYAFARLKSGGTVFEVLTRQEILNHRSRSRSASNGPWVTDFARMARKSAIRTLMAGGLVPLSAEIVRAIDIDSEDIKDVTDARASGSALDSLRQLTEQRLSSDDDANHIESIRAEFAKCSTIDEVTETMARLQAQDESLKGDIVKLAHERIAQLR